MTSRTGWGVAIIGHSADLAIYAGTLKVPFDPWVERHGEEVVLRSSAFDDSQLALEVRERAAALVEELNGALAILHDARAVTVGGVVQFCTEGSLPLIIQPGTVEIRGSSFFEASLTAIGPDGRPMPSPSPQKSKAQAWVEVAEVQDLMADALVYFGRRGNDWFDIYKALECLERKFGPTEAEFKKLGWAPPRELKRLKRTANDGRHAHKKFKPHQNPFSLEDARALLASLIRRGFKELEAQP